MDWKLIRITIQCFYSVCIFALLINSNILEKLAVRDLNSREIKEFLLLLILWLLSIKLKEAPYSLVQLKVILYRSDDFSRLVRGIFKLFSF